MTRGCLFSTGQKKPPEGGSNFDASYVHPVPFQSANSLKDNRIIGGDGGDRTPVRQSAAIGSTCIVTSII